MHEKTSRVVRKGTLLIPMILFLVCVPQAYTQCNDTDLQGQISSVDRADRIKAGEEDYLRMEIRANTFTGSQQGSPVLAFDGSGGMLAVWESRRQEDGNYGVYAQRLSALGKRIGGEFKINLTKRSTQWKPAVALDPAGSAWFGWDSFGQDGNQFGCFARRFGCDLQPMGLEIQINEETLGDQTGLTLISGKKGGLVAAWIGPCKEGTGRKAYVCRFSPEGKRLGAPILVDDCSEKQESLVCLAGRKDGGFIAAWAAAGPDSRPAGIMARIFAFDGHPLTKPFKLNDTRDAGAIEPGIAVSPDDGFVVAWMENEEASPDYHVKARLFGPDGKPRAPSFLVHAAGETHQSGAAVAVAEDGGFCIAWNALRPAPERMDIHAQLFDRAANPLGSPFMINRTVKGTQALLTASGRRCMAYGPHGQLAFAWSGESDLGDGSAANITLLIPATSRVTADLDGSGEIDPRDVTLFYDLLTGACTDPLLHARADLNRDGRVDTSDLEGVLPEGNNSIAQAAQAGMKRLETYHRMLEETGLVLEKEKEAKRLSMEKARAEGPAFVVKTDIAVPYEPPVRDPDFQPAGLFGGDPSPMGGRGDFGFQAITNTGWTPPDPHVAVGPGQLVAMTNGAIAFFDKDGTKTFQDEIENNYGFWGSVGATGFVFDPEAIYDPFSDRFMAMACERDSSGGGKSFFLLAVSDDSDPNGTWYKYRLDVTGLAGDDIDSPNIAVDQDVIYLTADFFTGGQKYLVYMLEKAPLLIGSPPGIRKSILITGSQSYGIPVVYENAPAMYMIEHFESSNNTKVRLHAITDPLGTPVVQNINLTVPNYQPPEYAPQQGTSTKIITFDARFWSCVYRNGSLWAAHHQGKNRVMSRWYEIDMADWPNSGVPTLVQSGDIDPGPDVRTFFNSISVDDFGNAVHCFARSSPAEHISIGRAYRKADDPLGTMQPMEIIKDSLVPYTSNRWGDYSAVVVDPTDNATFWYHHEYTSTGSWNTWIASIQVEEFSLTVDVDTLSEATGGTATFTLQNPGHAGKDYLLLGTLSGTSPGFTLPGGLVMPINWDLFTSVIVKNLGSPFLSGFLGTLDGNGDATAVLIAPALPGLAGATMDFAYAQDGKVWDFVSNNVSIQIVP